VLNRLFRVLALALALASVRGAIADDQVVKVVLTFEDQPLPGVTLQYRDDDRAKTVIAVTGQDGAALFRLPARTAARLLGRPLPPFTFELDRSDVTSRDFVLATPRVTRGHVTIVASRSAEWRMRTKPRVCDQLARTQDIPVGALDGIMSARDYDAWYAGLTPGDIGRCRTLAQLQQKVGSLAPWYFYAYKGQLHDCVDGRASEIDWAAWYRELLQHATGANPGECEADWENWWKSQGYPPVPDNPARVRR
jgi:hypothetical protein